MIRLGWRLMLAGFGFFPSVLFAGNSASITIGGVVSPVVQTTVLTQPVGVDVSASSGEPIQVATVRCEHTSLHEVIVETGSLREVLQGTKFGHTTVYLVNSPRGAEKVLITIVSE